jgi:hypothetical protein
MSSGSSCTLRSANALGLLLLRPGWLTGVLVCARKRGLEASIEGEGLARDDGSVEARCPNSWSSVLVALSGSSIADAGASSSSSNSRSSRSSASGDEPSLSGPDLDLLLSLRALVAEGGSG